MEYIPHLTRNPDRWNFVNTNQRNGLVFNGMYDEIDGDNKVAEAALTPKQQYHLILNTMYRLTNTAMGISKNEENLRLYVRKGFRLSCISKTLNRPGITYTNTV